MSIEIMQISEDEWRMLRDVRLRALSSDPTVFSSNHAREAAFPEATWRSRLSDPDGAIFIVYADQEPAGMTGIVIDRNDFSKCTALLWGSWLRPDLRGRGYSSRMYKARIEWAMRHSTCARIIVSHRESNLASKRANQKHGFRWMHTELKVWNDGNAEKDHFYELVLDKGRN